MLLVGEEAVKIEQSGSFTWDNPERPTLAESVTNHSLTHLYFLVTVLIYQLKEVNW